MVTQNQLSTRIGRSSNRTRGGKEANEAKEDGHNPVASSSRLSICLPGGGSDEQEAVDAAGAAAYAAASAKVASPRRESSTGGAPTSSRVNGLQDDIVSTVVLHCCLLDNLSHSFSRKLR